MSVLLLLAILALLTAVAGAALVAAAGRAHPAGEVATLAAARRHENVTTGLALGAGVAAGATALVLAATHPGVGPGAPGVLAGLAPAAGALVHLAVHAVGERSWPRPVGDVRTAALRRRTVAEIAGRRAWPLLATAGLLLLTLVLTGATATETGRAVPSLISPAAAAAGVVGGTSGPYPGWPYGLPVLAGAGLVLLATAAVVRLVARRPAVAGTRDADDAALRVTSAARVLAGSQVFLGGTLAAVLLVAGQALGNSDWLLPAWAAVGTAVVVAVGTTVLLGRALVPRRPAGSAPLGFPAVS